MANSPVLELQALACDPDSDILSVLMKAKMIAVKLGLSDLTEWIQLELNGYPSFDTVPEYSLKSQGTPLLIKNGSAIIATDTKAIRTTFKKSFMFFCLKSSNKSTGRKIIP